MKIRHVLIENFKSIKRFEHSFVNEMTGEVRPITAIFGDNGSGKTSVLQAIALVVSLATGKIENPSEFEWRGFLATRIGSLGSTYIKVEIQFDEDELMAEREFNEFEDYLDDTETQERLKTNVVEPVTTLEFRDGKIEITPESGKKLLDVKGFFSVNPTIRLIPEKLLERLGSLYWFDQYRNLASGFLGDSKRNVVSSDWQLSIANLRESLISWWFYHQQRKSDSDVIKLLENGYSKLFPGAKFIGTELMDQSNTRPRAADWFFLIQREGTMYDISEMSSGEQVVFGMLYDFVSNKISNSIILIDELELHLHPPEQQAFYNSLRKIGPDCQFIITSHSNYLKEIIPKGARIRLEGGRLCL